MEPSSYPRRQFHGGLAPLLAFFLVYPGTSFNPTRTAIHLLGHTASHFAKRGIANPPGQKNGNDFTTSPTVRFYLLALYSLIIPSDAELVVSFPTMESFPHPRRQFHGGLAPLWLSSWCTLELL
ncbi:hypothetical protein CEXT_685671 [Caerostris extrusa]|uniref:Uncharacterized protein n=1 Tax=Caerostris extrusa TaxID=172846 RepID=A0AAV4S0R7_CAEEX|nr:hypothetical protein CEXT_685671 [Caerostris extrusa]